MNTDVESQDDALPFEGSVFEVQHESDAALRDSEIIQHLAAFVVRDSVYNFYINQNGTKNNKVRDKLPDVHSPKLNGEPALLIERDCVLFEKNSKRILIKLLVQAMPKLVQDLKSEPNNAMRLFPQNQLRIFWPQQIDFRIRVHPCPSVVKHHFRRRAYSMESTSAWRLASMMLLLTPTVPHSRLPSLDMMRTRVFAAVPVAPLMMRTL